ncbi:MAG: 16S rRNA (guanine(966)-N(2))-methyltransferase RsmD [Verrucomicrobia bacterium]|nr:16S rRNA (guanine(966)-N(2))-methyltransferase RsmD [Verrucomicrobiota bacterium]
MSLRIIGGEFKGRTLKSPSESFTKPTLSLMRKSVFDICQNIIEDSRFLDLFACSGAMGIEAISRGASHTTFIEKDRKTSKILLENIKSFNLEEKTDLLTADVFTVIKTLKKDPYDIIYIDPPYPISKEPNSPVLSLLHFLDKSSLLAPKSTLFVEEGAPGTLHPEKETFERLRYKNSRKFGAALLHQLFIE